MGHVIADAIFLIVGLLIVWLCAKRGFIRCVFSQQWCAVLIACFLGRPAANLICEKWLGNAVHGFVYNKINGAYQVAADSFDAQAAIDSLPNFLMTEERKAILYAAEGSGEELVNSMTDSISSPIASGFSTMIGYFAVFLIAWIVFCILTAFFSNYLKRIKKFSVLNTVLGCILGIGLASVILFFAASILKEFGAAIYTESVIIKFFGASPLNKIF